jgi:hypothetical protein
LIGWYIWIAKRRVQGIALGDLREREKEKAYLTKNRGDEKIEAD